MSVVPLNASNAGTEVAFVSSASSLAVDALTLNAE